MSVLNRYRHRQDLGLKYLQIAATIRPTGIDIGRIWDVSSQFKYLQIEATIRPTGSGT